MKLRILQTEILSVLPMTMAFHNSLLFLLLNVSLTDISMAIADGQKKTLSQYLMR